MLFELFFEDIGLSACIGVVLIQCAQLPMGTQCCPICSESLQMQLKKHTAISHACSPGVRQKDQMPFLQPFLQHLEVKKTKDRALHLIASYSARYYGRKKGQKQNLFCFCCVDIANMLEWKISQLIVLNLQTLPQSSI